MSYLMATIRDLAVERGLVGGPFGSSLGASDYVSTGVPVIRGANLGGRQVSGDFVFVSPQKFDDELARNSAEPGDLVFTQRGTLGQIAIVPWGAYDTYVVSQSQMRLRVDDVVADADFVYYACRTQAFLKQVADNAIATGVPHINLGILGRLVVPLPELDTQLAIAEVLGALDDKIAANATLAATSAGLISALYERAISDPGWTAVPLLDACSVDFGEAFKGDRFSEVGVGRPLIRIRDLKTSTPQIWTVESRRGEVLVMPGDVVLGMDVEFRPTVWLGEPGLLNQRVCRALGRTFGPAYTREALKQPLAEIEGQKSATTVIHLNKSDLERATVQVADPPSLAFFEALAEPIFASRVKLAAEDRALRALRDTLLPELMSGRQRVRDAEKAVGELV